MSGQRRLSSGGSDLAILGFGVVVVGPLLNAVYALVTGDYIASAAFSLLSLVCLAAVGLIAASSSRDSRPCDRGGDR